MRVFLSRAYQPFPLDLPRYAALNFDTTPEPRLDLKGLKIIRTHHSCFGLTPPEYAEHPDTLISDIPFDYLTLYAQAEEVHSDRVHACVAALSYGRSAQLYHPTPRGADEPIGAAGIRDRVTKLDMPAFDKRRDQQVELVRQILSNHFGAL